MASVQKLPVGPAAGSALRAGGPEGKTLLVRRDTAPGTLEREAKGAAAPLLRLGVRKSELQARKAAGGQGDCVLGTHNNNKQQTHTKRLTVQECGSAWNTPRWECLLAGPCLSARPYQGLAGWAMKEGIFATRKWSEEEEGEQVKLPAGRRGERGGFRAPLGAAAMYFEEEIHGSLRASALVPP